MKNEKIDIRPSTPQPMTDKSALQYFKEENVKMGWNLGCSLDAIKYWEPNSKAEETAWGNPIVTQTFFDGLKETGFDIVRIPCTWIGHIGPSPDYKIDENRLHRVAEAVSMAHNAGMKTIINIMHDGCYMQPERGTWGFQKFAEVFQGKAVNHEIKEQLFKVWTQIAEYFINYGDNLIFETMNEIHSGNWGHGASQDEINLLFDWNQTALNAIRETGGNNRIRFVAVPGLGCTEADIVINAYKKGKLLPDDGENGAKKLIVAVHFYAPAHYTVAEVTPTQGGEGFHLKHDITQDELNANDKAAHNLRETFIDNGIAVYFGEWGAPGIKRSVMEQKIKDSHLEYISRVAKAASKNGILPIYWDGVDFSIIDRTTGKPMQGFCTEVFEAYKLAVFGE